MALSAGDRLGPYEILEPLGAGGMGEVYRARDTRLDRTVAVKVLPSDLAADPALRARLEREGRAISALAHPNICTLHDVGEENGQTFLVMEHLVGQTLAVRLGKGPLPLEQVLEVATQIAEGLAAAHKQGIVHRDLKPANVMLTKTGVRLLDFGLARLTAHGERPAVGGLTSAPTEAAPLTGVGTIMGTLPYMAPEQVEGKTADARTDLWALGAIVYEMLSGVRAFQASTPTGLVGAILERDPAPLAEKQPLTPPSLERLVRQCLAKDPDERWDTAHDVAVRLREIAGTNQEVETGLRAPRTPRWVIPALGVVALAALVAGVLVDRLALGPAENVPSAQVLRGDVDLRGDLRIESGAGQPVRTELTLSPDGALLVWAGREDEDQTEPSLHLRRLDTGETALLSGTAGASQPFFSPDGRWIGFTAATGESQVLRKVPVEGGLVVDLARLSWWPMGASWGRDGRIYLGSRFGGGGIQWVADEGGPLREITTADPAREVGHRLPSVLPGGRALLFTTMPLAFGVTARIEAVSLATGDRKVVVEDGADARYLPTGHLVFTRQGVLMAAPFDLPRLELAGPPVPVIEGVSQALNMGNARWNSGAAQLALSDSGLLVYASGGIHEDTPIDLVLVDEAGRAAPLPGFDRPLISPQLQFSPDGRLLAFPERARSGLLWLFDIERQTYRALSDRGLAASPRWSPDGTRLVVGWAEGGSVDLWMVPLDGGDWERLIEGEGANVAPSWSPDGRFLAYVRYLSTAGDIAGDIVLYRFEDRQVVPFLASKASEAYPEFSPDGRWLAYASDESGRFEVYVTSFPDKKQALTVSDQGGTAPAWSRDGRRLFYSSLPSSSGERSMMAVTVRYGPQLSLSRPASLFPYPFVHLDPMRSYDLHPDGRRFLVGVLRDQKPTPPITRLNLVHNWFTELEGLSPVN